ncbi:MAG: hypothetical protein ACREDM_02875 [Methylocella sp.]
MTSNAWTVAQLASAIPRLFLTVPQNGTGTTWYASVYVRKPSGSPSAAYPGVVFSSDNQGAILPAPPIGFSVVLNELNGDIASSYNILTAPNTPFPLISHSWADYSVTYGVNTLTAGRYTFYEMWVFLTDSTSSTELTVALYPTSIGTIGPWLPIQGGQIGSSAVFTNIIVSTTHP